MARTAEGEALTEQHRQAQIKIRAAALRDFATLWPLWQGDRRSFERLVSATVPLVTVHRRVSASLAAAFFEAFRAAERVPGSATPHIASDLNVDRLVASLYVTGDVMTANALEAGLSPEAAMRTALVRTSGAVGRHVLNGGRDTVILSSGRDRRSRGWERVTSGKPCPFCAMLAARGAVYSENTADFQAHDHCACSAQPAY